jgi:hypothetical protein
MPRKKEIARIFHHAKKAHELRVSRGEIAKDSPLTFVDIGGSNGFLGRLMTEFARSQGLKVSYIVVDPDERTLKKARDYYSEKDTDLHFEVKNSSDYIESLYQNDPEILGLFLQRKEVIRAWNKKYRLFSRWMLFLDSEKNRGISGVALTRLLSYISSSCGIVSSVEDRLSHRASLSDMRDEWKEQFKTQCVQEVKGLTQAIEKKLDGRVPTADMVINSWMPPDTDFTADIRFVNAAAIMYAIHNRHATGIQVEDAGMRPGEEISYGPGLMYTLMSKWNGPSNDELRGASEDRNAKTILMQHKRKYGFNPLATDRYLRDASTKPYPWEEKMPYWNRETLTELAPEQIFFRGKTDWR